MEQVKIRVIKQNELGELGDMLCEAIYQSDENNLIPRTALEIPEVNTYIKDFGKRKGDYCLVADLDKTLSVGMGANYIRRYKMLWIY